MVLSSATDANLLVTKANLSNKVILGSKRKHDLPWSPEPGLYQNEGQRALRPPASGLPCVDAHQVTAGAASAAPPVPSRGQITSGQEGGANSRLIGAGGRG